MHSALDHTYSTTDTGTTQTEQLDGNDADQLKHLMNMASTLLDLQKTGQFCDVYFFCSNGHVRGNLWIQY